MPADYLELFCAVYAQVHDSLYHWAFAIYTQGSSSRGWHIYEVVQERRVCGGREYRAVHRQANPNRSTSCLKPLVPLGLVHKSKWAAITEKIESVPIAVPRRRRWNCQSYVLDIWNRLLMCRIVDGEAWQRGRDMMLPYHGQARLCGYSEKEGERRFTSNEFVYDSSDE
ncbi:hypothetical protein DCS_08041 [Drechmeria coniospora]|uniref:Uncharacterized protein n=1 Tax=Drechmeria coniospora TaxID=98403 RepID=A0A151GG53_DRECN|nr:hypothetical protein DCS_08041 [Drechmeria coniospora]KYK56075.1 hypothetical protein DCS_08041 [Drechmeria coniospora]